MAFQDGSDGIFQINDGSTLRDISLYIVSLTGLPGERTLSEATSLADSGRMTHPSIEDVEFTLELLWDNTASTGPDAVLGVLRTAAAATAFDFGPEGKTGSDIKYSGNCRVRTYVITAAVGNMTRAAATLKVEGVVARGTY